MELPVVKPNDPCNTCKRTDWTCSVTFANGIRECSTCLAKEMPEQSDKEKRLDDKKRNNSATKR